MAGPQDPFTPGPTADPTAGLPDAGTFENIRDQWMTFLDKPGGRGALLNAGIALLQPPSFGDTPASQIGRAIGHAGEGVARTEAMDLRQQEAASKAELRSAQAGAAEARAGAAGSRAELQADRLRSQEAIKDLQSRILINSHYNKYKAQIQALNAKKQADIINPGQPLDPIMSEDEFVASSPLLRGLRLGGPGGVGPGSPIAQPPQAGTGPRVGEVVRGYKFLGGDPANPSSWEKE